jgi:guanylate kinase
MVDCYPGNLIIVAAPSGGGKTSLVKQLISILDNIEVSISHTTRAMRPGEKEAVDYFFIEQQQFVEMIEADAFIEHAQVFNHYYGTSVAQINSRLQAGIDVILDIDWQGAQQIRRIFPTAVSIFILPPSLDILQERLFNRRQDNHEVIDKRMQQAQDELSHFAEFDYLIVNDDFAKAAMELQAIVIANRLRMVRQKSLQRKLLSFLLASQ